jgi:hypothetical protein
MIMSYNQLKMTGLGLIVVLVTVVLTLGNTRNANAHPKPPADWTLATQKDGIEVFYKLSDCDGAQRILFQIRNHTSSNQLIDFACTVATTSKPLSVASLKNSVAANSVLEGTCGDKPFQSTFISLPKDSSFETLSITLK